MEADEHAPGKTRQPEKVFWRRFKSRQVIKVRKKRNKINGAVRRAIRIERNSFHAMIDRVAERYINK